MNNKNLIYLYNYFEVLKFNPLKTELSFLSPGLLPVQALITRFHGDHRKTEQMHNDNYKIITIIMENLNSKSN